MVKSIKRLKKKTKHMDIQSVLFANLEMLVELLIINGFGERFLKMKSKMNVLLKRLKRYIQNIQIKVIAEYVMTWNDIMI